jgi:hypothetical protein
MVGGVQVLVVARRASLCVSRACLVLSDVYSTRLRTTPPHAAANQIHALGLLICRYANFKCQYANPPGEEFPPKEIPPEPKLSKNLPKAAETDMVIIEPPNRKKNKEKHYRCMN